jgi:hypothetical protein
MDRLGLLSWHQSLGHKFNLYSNVVRFPPLWPLDAFVVTCCVLQATQDSSTIFNWQGNSYIHSRETSYFHGRVWGSLSVHLGMFCFTDGYVVRLLTRGCPRKVVYMTLSFIQWLGSLVLIIDSAIVQVVVRPPSIML